MPNISILDLSAGYIDRAVAQLEGHLVKGGTIWRKVYRDQVLMILKWARSIRNG